MQKDGKLITLTNFSDSNNGITICRYNTDGSRDASLVVDADEVGADEVDPDEVDGDNLVDTVMV